MYSDLFPAFEIVYVGICEVYFPQDDVFQTLPLI